MLIMPKQVKFGAKTHIQQFAIGAMGNYFRTIIVKDPVGQIEKV